MKSNCRCTVPALVMLLAGIPTVSQAAGWALDPFNPAYVSSVPYQSPAAAGSGYSNSAGGKGGSMSATSTGNIAGVTVNFVVTYSYSGGPPTPLNLYALATLQGNAPGTSVASSGYVYSPVLRITRYTNVDGNPFSINESHGPWTAGSNFNTITGSVYISAGSGGGNASNTVGLSLTP